MTRIPRRLIGAIAAGALSLGGLIMTSGVADAAAVPCDDGFSSITVTTNEAFAPGNFCLWAYGSNGLPANVFIFQTDGNLVLYHYGVAYWQSHTYGVGATSFVVQGDGNMVVYRGSTALWQSGTYGTHASRYAITVNGGAAATAVSHLWWSSYGIWITDWQI